MIRGVPSGTGEETDSDPVVRMTSEVFLATFSSVEVFSSGVFFLEVSFEGLCISSR